MDDDISLNKNESMEMDQQQPSSMSKITPQMNIYARNGDLEMCRKLIEEGADVNCEDSAGWTPLHEASLAGNYELSEYLISNGANVNKASYEGVCALHDAVQSQNSRLVWLLLSNGADITKKTSHGDLPIDYANNNSEIIQLFNTNNPQQTSSSLLNFDIAERQPSNKSSNDDYISGFESSVGDDGDLSNPSNSKSRTKENSVEASGTINLLIPENNEKAFQIASTSFSTTTTTKSNANNPTKAIAEKSPANLNNLKISKKRLAKSNKAAIRNSSIANTTFGAIAEKATSSINDIYEFHSSPESNEQPFPSISSTILQKSAILNNNNTNSGANNINNSSPPVDMNNSFNENDSQSLSSKKQSTRPLPFKRIKTAALAKELLAAAAASASASPLEMNSSSPIQDEQQLSTTELNDDFTTTTTTPTTSNLNNTIEQLTKEINNEDENFSLIDSTTIMDTTIDTTIQSEPKKVPPLRILLPKTPSEEDSNNIIINSSSNSSEIATSLSPSNSTRKSRGKQHLTTTTEKKDSTQRLTRSRVRQTGISLDEVPRYGNNKRKNNFRNGNNLTTTTSTITTTNNLNETTNQNEQQYEELFMGTDENETLIMDDLASESLNEMIDDDGSRGGATTEEQQQQQHRLEINSIDNFTTNSLFSMNSFDQTLEMRKIIKEKCLSEYKERLERTNLIVKNSENQLTKQVEEEMKKFKYGLTKKEQIPLVTRVDDSWPEVLQKLAIEQAKTRQKLEMEHCLERERLFEYGEKEYSRLLINSRSTLQTANNSNEINIIRLFREQEMYNPATIGLTVYDSLQINLNKSQLLQRLKNMSYSTKNRQNLEVQSLFVCQKADWQKTVQRLIQQTEPKIQLLNTNDVVTQIPAMKLHIGRMVEVSTLAYSKMVLHAIKYPHCHVRGVLLGHKNSEDGNNITIVDSIPAIHNSLVTPILETLFIHLDIYCKEEKLKIVGVYFANQNLNDNGFDEIWAKIALDKLSSPVVIQIENSKLNLNAKSSCLIASIYDGKWKQKSCKIDNEEDTIAITSIAIQNKLYRDLFDFENHLDKPCLMDFFNTTLNIKIENIL